MRLILAEELDTLTVQDLQEWDRGLDDGSGIFLNVIDKRNLTSERLTRLGALVRERDDPSEFLAVDAEALSTKLQHIPSRRSPSPTPSESASTTVTAGAELTADELTETTRQAAYENVDALKAVGGRPSREIHPRSYPFIPSRSQRDEEWNTSDHWYNEEHRTRNELQLWLNFRWHQYKVRGKSKTFNRYKMDLQKHPHQGKNRLIELQLDRQTKSDEWMEYCIYEERKRRALQNRLNDARRQHVLAENELMKAKQNGSVGIAANVLLQRAAEMNRYTKKISLAQKEVTLAQKRLEASKSEPSLSVAERDAMVEQAETDLAHAGKRLDAEFSVEMEQLRKESKREYAQEYLEMWQREVGFTRSALEQADALLEWINGQSEEISQRKHDLIAGWEGYYLFMHERVRQMEAEDVAWSISMRLKKRTDAEEARDDLIHPQQRIRPIQAHLAWIEREFPHISMMYAPSRDANPLESTNETDLPSSNPPACVSQRKSSSVKQSTRYKARSSKERSPLGQIQPSRICKPSQRKQISPRQSKRSHSNGGLVTATQDALSEEHAYDRPDNSANELERKRERRSERLANQTQSAISTRSLNLARTKDSTRRRVESNVRRSARLSDERMKKISESEHNIRPTAKNMELQQQAARRTRDRVKSFYVGKPQGISKTRTFVSASRNSIA